MSQPGWWPAARAALITLALLIHGIHAAPVPHVVTRDDLKNPVSAEEVERWAERLTTLGYAISAEELGERVMAITGIIGGAHRELREPFRPFLRFTGTGQGWALFANPDTHPGRLSIRIERDGKLQDLYLQLDPELDWWRAKLAYRRVRGCWDAGGYRARPRAIYTRFSRWVADRVFEANPDVDAVEVRTLRTHTTLPSEPDDPKVEVRHVVRTRRGDR